MRHNLLLHYIVNNEVVVRFTPGVHTACLQTAQVRVAILNRDGVHAGGAPSAGGSQGPRSRLTRLLLLVRRGLDREEEQAHRAAWGQGRVDGHATAQGWEVSHGIGGDGIP